MPAAFPTIKSGAVACYGSTRSHEFQTEVLTCQDLSTRRWSARDILGRFDLVFIGINGYDLSKIRAHWISAKGSFDSTWSLTISGATFTTCSYDSDEFVFNEVPGKVDHYSGSLKIRQTIP